MLTYENLIKVNLVIFCVTNAADQILEDIKKLYIEIDDWYIHIKCIY